MIMNTIMENILSRRSIRKYRKEQIKLEELETILLAGSYAPTGRAMQSWKFTAIQNQEVLNKVNETIRQTILAIKEERFLEKAKDENANFLFNAPTYVIVSNLKDNPNSMADSALAIGNMMLAAHSLGIGSCWLNLLPNLTNQPQIRSLLNELDIPENHQVYGSVAFGYPDEVKEAAPRKDVINIIK
ncbi:MAG TPA: nitroreductase [Haloplasmataceae bacterium]